MAKRLCHPARNIAIEHRFQGAEIAEDEISLLKLSPMEKIHVEYSGNMELNYYQTLLWKLQEYEINNSP